MSNKISYGTTSIHYKIKRTQRKTLAIEVHPDSSVWVVAPIEATLGNIQCKMEKRASWIARQQRFFNGRPNNTLIREWVSGESLHYLGRQYRLKVIEGEANVKMSGKYLNVSVPDKTWKRKVAALVDSWYMQHARTKFEERLKLVRPIMDREGIEMNDLIIRKLKKRWGSCTKKGNIVLNTDLIKVPIHCIDYVILHEICHLKYHHHGREFWSLLTKYCPEWPKTKERLERVGT